MLDLKYLPISYSDHSLLFSLMQEEEKAWMQDLGWDYSPIRQILATFIRENLLPGYVAIQENKAIGYTYFLMNQSKGIIGAIYVTRHDHSKEIADKLLSLAISGLKDSPAITRIEAQIMPFNDIELTEVFTLNGFRVFPRQYLSLDLSADRQREFPVSPVKIVRWDSSDLSRLADILLKSYLNQADAVICADYRTVSGCEGYLRSILENPGCGVFMPEVSFLGLQESDEPCGFILGCRLSDGVGMIPQIAVHPNFQGKKLGDVLMNLSLEQFSKRGFQNISLTVTPENQKACEWYGRLGFKSVKDFGAFVWER